MFAQSTADAAVEITATTNSTTPSIALNWVGNATTTQYNIYRKLKTATAWDLLLLL
ncbi:MAG: hypothetical protein IPJ32_12825 [Sphingobacteriaceae bacterium]|nr:hypothetical protein [Sphingobacteriaceae bacterium]